MTSHFLYDVDVSFLLAFGAHTFSRKENMLKYFFVSIWLEKCSLKTLDFVASIPIGKS